MADKRTHRAEKKRQKDKYKREAARRDRGSRKPTGTSFSAGAAWPVGECWASDTWGERGAQVLVTFSRMHPSGMGSVAFFELDLAEEGVTSVATFAKVTASQVMGETGQRGGDRTMVTIDPALAVKLVETARELSPDTVPAGFEDAVSLFGDVRAEDCDEQILTGLEDTEEVEAPTGGLLAGVKRFFGLA